jgi:hypothetical protein
MIATMGLPEFISTLGMAIMVAFAICAIEWLGYCITSIARAADALERIADALEKDDEEKGGAK